MGASCCINLETAVDLAFKLRSCRRVSNLSFLLFQEYRQTVELAATENLHLR